jgi:sulfatase maturation enzyme AslB (radical SAM superfamily)
MKYLCTAPWTHTYVSPQGERRLCCASREDSDFQKQYIDTGEQNPEPIFNPISIKDHWNSEYMKDIRKRMMDGEAIPQCVVCNENVLNLHTYRSYFTDTLFPHKIQELIDTTDDTGYTTMVPVSYDYRLSNLCNFKCRMCGDQLSSSWEAENKVNDRLQDEPWLIPNNRRKITNFQKEVLEEELQAAVDEDVIEEIYWVGGEPLMWERHWTIMDQLKDSKRKKEITIRYNTNLSRVDYKKYNLFDMLEGFKAMNICASIDGAGAIGEYIRTGIKWDDWLDNFKRGIYLNEQYGDDGMVFDVTLTTPGLFGLKDLFDVVTELDVKSYFKFTYGFTPNVLMCPDALPKSIVEPYCNELIEYMESRKTEKTQVYIDSLKNLIERKSFDEQWEGDDLKYGMRNGKENLLFLEKIRDQELTFREILNEPGKEWWDGI